MTDHPLSFSSEMVLANQNGKSQTPIRIQRKRAKGWKMPENTIYVGRGSVWGNPFVIGEHGNRDDCIKGFVRMLTGFFTIQTKGECNLDRQRAYPKIDQIKQELRGKNLACWCRPDQACHADILLRIANEPEAE